MRIQFSSLVFSFSLLTVCAQIPLSERLDRKDVNALFQMRHYESVIMTLEGIEPKTTEDRYMLAISKSRVGETDIGTLRALVEQNPIHSLNAVAKHVIAEEYANNGDFFNAKQWAETVDPEKLNVADRSSYYFLSGIFSLDDQQYEIARNNFNRVDRRLLVDSIELSYYQGITYYYLNDYVKALEFLDPIEDRKEFNPSIQLFLSKIKFANGDYAEVISSSEMELTPEKTEVNAELHRVIGEAYAQLDSQKSALNYFEKAIDLYPVKAPPATFYQAGITSYGLGLRHKAIGYFEEAGLGSDSYARLSAFQLGRLYLSLSDQQKALSAFMEASLSGDDEIRAEALFMAGKLNTDLTDYTEGINMLKVYLDEYPDGTWVSEAQDLLGEAYLRTSNYDQAIQFLNEQETLTASQQILFQKVTFQKAKQQFSDGDLIIASKWFEESLKYPVDEGLTNDAHLHLAEASLAEEAYQEAIERYDLMQSNDPRKHYGRGYAFYNLYNYQEAAGAFSTFLSGNGSRKLKQDARLRLADCYYALKAYDKALATYKQLGQEATNPYVSFQIGLLHQNQSNRSEAIKAFERVLAMDGNHLKDQAAFYIAAISFEQADFSRSEFLYSSFISKYPQSPLVVKAYQDRAVCRVNLNKLIEAVNDYSFILKNHLQSENAVNAILGLQELEQKGVKIDGLSEMIANYQAANPDDDSVEAIAFEYAKSKYFSLDYRSSVELLQKFIERYPQSGYIKESSFYLADSHYRLGELELAESVLAAMNIGSDKFSGRILQRLGDVNESLKDFEGAVEAFTELSTTGRTAKERYNGMNGLMRVYFTTGEYLKCIDQANQILTSEWVPFNGERQAKLYIAKSYDSMGRFDEAVEMYQALSQEEDQISAEASFGIARIKYDQGDHQVSLERLFEFNSRFGSYQQLISQSFLLIADNYLAIDELFQAKATLESIILNASDSIIVDQARKKLESVTNESEVDTIKEKGK